MSFLSSAATALDSFYGSNGLTSRIAALEVSLIGLGPKEIESLLVREGIQPVTLSAALEVKRIAGQVNVAIHALGIALALPYILEDGEVVSDTSLGAGNTS